MKNSNSEKYTLIFDELEKTKNSEPSLSNYQLNIDEKELNELIDFINQAKTMDYNIVYSS